MKFPRHRDVGAYAPFAQAKQNLTQFGNRRPVNNVEQDSPLRISSFYDMSVLATEASEAEHSKLQNFFLHSPPTNDGARIGGLARASPN